MEIIIPTHGRAGAVTTHTVVKGSRMCVSESQLSAYKGFYPKHRFIVHPDGVRGISPKRDWIIKKFPAVFMLDDDIKAVRRLYLSPAEKKDRITPEQAQALILDTYNMLKGTGITLFGFSKSPSPLHYDPSKPIRMNGFLRGAALGFVDTEGYDFPDRENMVGEDEYICLMNAFTKRRMWIDNRFFFEFKTDNYNVGGCEVFRDKKANLDSFKFLKKTFGEAIFLDKKFDGSNANENEIIKWRCKIPY